MDWYTGDIGAAINESKNKKLIFLVFIHDSSKTCEQIWNNQTIIDLCKNNCVSLKLDSESQTCSFFKQIYPVSICPTTYLIGISGKPIETITGDVSEDEFMSKFQQAITVHIREKNPTVESNPSPNNEPSTSQDSNENQKKGNSEDQKKNIDERVALAKEKLKLIQEKKRAEEEEKQRNSEMERRKQGQEIIKAKREKEEQELRKIAEEKKKEKLEDDLAKKRILEKIQQDRDEKQKRYAQEKEEVQRSKEAEKKKLEQQKLLEKQAEAARNSNIARLQFRFVDGSSINSQFDPNQKLVDVKDFVTQKLREMNDNTSFTIHSTFPKREYTSVDMSQTLRELNLAPSASLLIIPIKSKAVKSLSNLIPTSSSSSTSSSTLSTVANDIFSLLFLPITIIWGVVSSFFGFAQNQPRGSVNQNREPNRSESSQNSRRRNIGNNSDNFGNLSDVRDDDDNATWNGNSTQQM